jgi:regulator of replication initiation timing
MQCELQRLSDHNEIKDMLTSKLSEMNMLHETIIEEQNYLVEENKQLNQELSKLKEEYVKAIVIKDKVNHINALILR